MNPRLARVPSAITIRSRHTDDKVAVMPMGMDANLPGILLLATLQDSSEKPSGCWGGGR